MLVKLDHETPRVRDEHIKYLSCHHLVNIYQPYVDIVFGVVGVVLAVQKIAYINPPVPRLLYSG